jgi:hypothetical protein
MQTETKKAVVYNENKLTNWCRKERSSGVTYVKYCSNCRQKLLGHADTAETDTQINTTNVAKIKSGYKTVQKYACAT